MEVEEIGGKKYYFKLVLNRDFFNLHTPQYDYKNW